MEIIRAIKIKKWIIGVSLIIKKDHICIEFRLLPSVTPKTEDGYNKAYGK
jgi:hypothetical protein